MSHSDEPSGSSKPVVKDKDPHNYRKVGYTMIVISVSLVLIGLLVWAIGDNYHFSSDIMANQEIDAMTPKHGFNLVYYDTAQPVGAKLKLLDAASTLDDAQQKQMQYAKQNPSVNGMVIIFNETLSANQKLVKDTIDAVVKAQAAKAQAAKDQAAKVLAAQAANATASQTPIVPPTTTAVNQTKSTVNQTKTTMPAVPISQNLGVNATVVTLSKNNATSVSKIGQSPENLGINSTVSVHVSHLNNTATSTTNNTSATVHNTKSISVSDNVGIQAK